MTVFDILADATIALPMVMDVEETDSSVNVCATLSTETGVTLEKSITIMLDTADDTG